MKYIIYAIVCAFPLQAYDISIGDTNHVTIAEIIAILSVCIMLYKKNAYIYPAYIKWVFLLIVWICLGAFFTINPFAVIAKSLKLLLNICVFILFYNYIIIRKNAIAVYNFIKKVSLVEAVFSIIGFYWINFVGSENILFRIEQSVDGVYRAVGTFNDANYLGLYIACVIVMIAIERFYTGSLSGKDYCIVIILFIALFMTMSRSSLLGMFFGIVTSALFITHGKIDVKKLISLMLLIAIITIGISLENPNFLDRYTTMFDLERGDVFVRIIQYYTAIAMIEDNPIMGVGAGNYMNYIDKYNSFTGGSLIPHNSILEIAAETGLVAVLLMIMFLYHAMRWMIQMRSVYSYMSLGIVICTFIMGMFYSNIYYQMQLFVFMAIAGAGDKSVIK